ncbi:MAG: hypothetical protein IPM95_02355 [Sphingobacteriales bacterium]|nr:hypothetical protein [Sphingobacteriales bacterium]
MNARVLIAALAGAVASFLLGWLFYGFLLPDFYAAHSLHYAGLEKCRRILLVFLWQALPIPC